jgi:hypothetical protein
MNDQCEVATDRVLAASRAFAGRQAVPGRIASQLNGERGADAGEPALNGAIQVLVGDLLTALTGLETALASDASKLSLTARCYQSADLAGAAAAARARAIPPAPVTGR